MLSGFNKEIQSDRIWPGASRSRRFRGTPEASIEAGAYEFFVRRGYAFIIGSVRGIGRFGGKFQLTALGDIKDIYGVIEWAAEQPWEGVK